ncbi:MAG: AAA family ATPase, partial [Burkholderiales bacterium]|nr:AAA family ATPase [Burkholderiales bacterium]
MNPASLPPEAGAVAPVRWVVRLLGQVQAIGAERTIARWPSRAVVALLATLALEPQRAHPREQLIERLWPGVAPDIGRNRLRQALSVLRALLEPAGRPGAAVLLADRAALRVVPGAIDCDVHRFAQQARAGQLEAAMALYRGEFMPGFYDEWVLAERERLAAIHARLATVGLRTMPTPRSAGHAAAGPAAIWRQAVDLPHYLTRLFGAEPAAARLRAMLLEHRLVTVTGPGGIGKTRLAVEVAHSLVPAGAQAAEAARFDRIGFVPLVDCRDRTQLLDALQSHLRAAAEGDALERIASALHGRRTLLLLDNFEQLVDGGAELVATLLARAPSLQLLVTSRRALGVDGERLFVAPRMTPPAAQAGLDEVARNPAMALFVDRAQAVRADFHLGSGNRAPLVALLHHLDGLPLAVELAASRVRSLSPAEMLAMLQRPPGTRGDVLARRGTRAALDPRHASMQQVVGWSWGLLDARQQALLQALVPFEGGCTSAAAAAVLGDTDVALKLDELVGHSLLVTQDGMCGRIRFALHEPVREFAATRTGAQQARRLRRRHREWVAAWAQALPATPPLPEVRDEWPNVAAAIGSAAADGRPQDALELLLRLQRVVEDVGLPASALDAAAQAADA